MVSSSHLLRMMAEREWMVVVCSWVCIIWVCLVEFEAISEGFEGGSVSSSLLASV